MMLNIKNNCAILLILFVLLAVLVAGNACGQTQQATITVKDSKNGEPVAFANVCFEGLKSGVPRYAITTIDGKAINEVKERAKIAVSCMGYNTFRDTISPGQSKVIRLAPTIMNMDELVVTAQYTPERADKSIYKVEVISSHEIEMKAATNMADLLKDQAAMRVSQSGVLGTSLTIQGLTGENVKFLQDGVPLIGRLNGNFDLSQINLQNVDHVEVVEGPMSVIYGSNALAGVINIITKENKTSELSTSVNGYYESVGWYNFDGSISYNLKKHGFSINGGRNFFGGYSYDSSRLQDFKPRRQYFFNGYYIYTAKNLKIKATGDYFNELLEDKGPLLPSYYETAFDSYFTTVRYTGRADASVTLPRSHFLSILASYSSYVRTKMTYYKDLTTLTENVSGDPSLQDTSGFYSLVGRATFAQNDKERKLNYQAGFDLDDEIGTGKRIDDKRQEIGDYAGFLSVTWDPLKLISIQPGIRLIYNTKYSAPVVYALSTKWTLSKNLNVRAAFARGFRAPDLKELYLDFVDVIHNITGNPDLKAETSYNFNAGAGYSHEKNNLGWTLEGSGYYNTITNKIELAQIRDLTYTYLNLSKYNTTGFEISGSLSLYPSFRIQAGLSETGVAAAANPQDPLTSYLFTTDITLSPTYQFRKPDISLSLFYKYTGKTPQFLVDGNSVSIGYISPYHMMDFTATKGFWKSRIHLSCGMKNIFNVKTVPSTGAGGGAHSSLGKNADIGYGRTVFLRLTFTYNKYK